MEVILNGLEPRDGEMYWAAWFAGGSTEPTIRRVNITGKSPFLNLDCPVQPNTDKIYLIKKAETAPEVEFEFDCISNSFQGFIRLKSTDDNTNNTSAGSAA
jgi:hypothetical protein